MFNPQGIRHNPLNLIENDAQKRVKSTGQFSSSYKLEQELSLYSVYLEKVHDLACIEKYSELWEDLGSLPGPVGAFDACRCLRLIRGRGCRKRRGNLGRLLS